MSTIYMDGSRNLSRSWVVRIAMCAVIGFVVGFVWVDRSESRVASKGTAQQPAALCCTPVDSRAGYGDVVIPHRALTEPQIDSTGWRDPAQSYRAAQRFVDCLLLNDRQVQGVKSQLEEMYEVDPTQPLIGELQRNEQQALAACQAVGPNDYRRIETLMNDAAQRGSADARFFLLARTANAEIERIAILRADHVDADFDGAAVDPHADAAVASLEKLALEGHRPAMSRLGDLLSGNLLVAAQPVRAAAWRIVALQAESKAPLSLQDIDDSGLLSGINDQDAAAAINEAQRFGARLGQPPNHQPVTRAP